jgi:hypothetical protein
MESDSKDQSLKMAVLPIVEAYRAHARVELFQMVNMKKPIDYLVTSMWTNMTTNLKSHFARKILAYMTSRLDVRGRLASMGSDKDMNVIRDRFLADLRMLNDALIQGNDVRFSNVTLTQVFSEFQLILPANLQKTVHYDLVAEPAKLIRSYMMLARL